MMRYVASTFCLLAVPFLAHAQTTPVTCSAKTLFGAYSLVLTGRDVPSTVVLTKNYAGVGTIMCDGVGSITGSLATNTNQVAGVTQTLAGTYTMPSNCVGTLNFSTGASASFTIIPYNKGANFTITGYDGTYQFTGAGAPPPSSCLTSTLSGTYAFSGNGYGLTAGAITGINDISGLLTFDGAGAISGNWSIATNGASFPDTISGKYTVTPGCIASATATDPTGLAYTLNFTVTTADAANLSVIGAAGTNSFNATAHSTFTNPGLAVANAAGVAGGTPPGSLFSIYGSNLASGQAQPTTNPLPTTLATATVTVNGELAPLTYADKGQINAQMPLDIVSGFATVVVKTGTTLSNAVAAIVPSTPVPGVFIYGANHAIAQNFPAYDLNSPTSAAPVGSVVIVYFTGGGAVQNGSSLVTGHATPNAQFPLMATASATIAGVDAPVQFAGLTPGFVGLYQANVAIPKVGAGDHNMVITIGQAASNTTVISTK
jgi:uncharacterized protein (TIGR03437 family)